MPQDSQQVLGDEIGRILSEANITDEQAAYIRTGFVEMIQKNTMIIQTGIGFPKLEVPNPVVELARKEKAAIMGVTEIAKILLHQKIFKMEVREVEDEMQHTVAIHLIRNTGI